MKYSGIGGQAVMEGIMMRNRDAYSLSVRLGDGSIHTDVTKVKATPVFFKLPFFRGMYSFAESLIVGMKTLFQSSDYIEDDEETKKKREENPEKVKKEEKAQMAGTLVISFALALLIFLALPFYLSKLFDKVIASETVIVLIEGLIRVVILIAYMALIARMEDIKRVYMYHGAEHKCINCVEHGLPLTVENARKSTRFHKRCGTSFLFIVVFISVFVFAFIRVDSRPLQLLLRIALMPVIAGISYEFLRLGGRSDNAVINCLAAPGLWLQRITTKEPDDSMLEVGIASVNAVFDWAAWQKETFGAQPEEPPAAAVGEEGVDHTDPEERGQL